MAIDFDPDGFNLRINGRRLRRGVVRQRRNFFILLISYSLSVPFLTNVKVAGKGYIPPSFLQSFPQIKNLAVHIGLFVLSECAGVLQDLRRDVQRWSPGKNLSTSDWGDWPEV